MLLRGTLSTRTLYGGFAVVMDMFCKQHKTSSIPYSTLKALNWRIAFLIAEGKREIGVIGKDLLHRLLICLPEPMQAVETNMCFST